MSNKNIEDTYPLTPLQEGILFHCQLAPDTGIYVSQIACALQRLDVEAFADAWQQVMQRHSILRTAFVWKTTPKPLQVVGRRVRLNLDQQDWRELQPDELESRYASFLVADRQRGFKLSRAPLMRLTLLRTEVDEHRFVWTHHHLLLDGWSTGIVMREVFELYAARCLGVARPLARPRPFRRYVEWCRKQDPEAAESFWRSTLAGFVRPNRLSVAGARGDGAERCERRVRLSRAETAAVEALGRDHGLTLNTVLLGAWARVVGCYCGDDDLVFGNVVAGRPPDVRQVEQMVGVFINTLPVRVRLPRSTPLIDWLRALQNDQAQVRSYEHSPLADVQRWSGLPPGTPLFESLLVFENYPRSASAQGEGAMIGVSDLRVAEETNYPLVLVVIPGERLALKLIYDGQRFAGAERLVERLQVVLTSWPSSPTSPVGELPLLSPVERHQLETLPKPAPRVEPPRYVDELIAEATEACPDSIAVVWDEHHLSYHELVGRAEALGGVLRRRGVGPGELVGILLERSPHLVSTLLAVLRTGGAYLPLDPSWPQSRLTSILEDAAVALVVSDAALAQRVPLSSDRLLVEDVPAEGDGQPAAKRRPEDLAYVMYTSGSTGRPKGVAVSHRGLSHYVDWAHRAYPVADGRGAPVHSSIGFDLTITSLFLPLVSGRTAELVPESAGIEGLAEVLARGGFSLAKITPSHLELLATLLPATGAVRQARALVVGGEALTGSHLAFWRSAAPETRVFNEYGPTEAVVGCCVFELSAGAAAEGPIAIGRPITGTDVYLLDHVGLPVPECAPGELWVGGAGLARGYYHRPAETAERFVPHLLARGRGERLYRTGDLARRRPDGELEYLGRVDEQLKIRGHRIEPGEIEAALLEHPAVDSAAVVAAEGVAGDRRLVAYAVGEDPPHSAALRSWLADRVPPYMVPAACVFLDRLPLTANGKVDRGALSRRGVPAPGPEMDRPRQLPRTPVEEMLARIWSQVLGTGAFLDDDFFELGGHSLLATQIVSRVRKAFGVELPLQRVFERPRLVDLSEEVEGLLRGSAREMPPIERVPRGEPGALSYGQQRLWFLDRLDPGSSAFNVALGVVLEGRLDVPALAATVAEVRRRHEVLRTSFVLDGEQPVLRIAPTEPFVLPVVDLSGLPAAAAVDEERRLVAADADRPFDLERGPVLRVTLLRKASDVHALLLSAHHIASDAWSLGVWVREVATLYRAYCARRPSPLPELAVQYSDFAAWHTRWLASGVLDEQLAYWRENLRDHPRSLALPVDLPRPPVSRHRGTSHRFLLPGELSGKIRELAQRQGATLYMTLLAAFGALLYRFAGQEDLCIGSPVAGRRRLETEELIGFFVNTLVLRTNVSGNPTFLELLARVRQTVLGAFAHQDVPFEKLVEELAPARDLGQSPFFQVMFFVQNAPMAPLDLPDLRLQPLQVENRRARYDLELQVVETPDGLYASFQYDVDLFAAATVERLAQSWRLLLEQIVDRPSQPISGYSLLREEKRSLMVAGFNEDLEDD